MADFQSLATVLGMLGYQMCLLMLATGRGNYTSTDGAVEAMFIIAFLCYTVAILLLLLIRLGDLKGNFPAMVSTCILLFLACLFLIVGLALYSSRIRNYRPPVYPTTVHSISLILAFTAGLLLSLDLGGCTGGGAGGKTAPGA